MFLYLRMLRAPGGKQAMEKLISTEEAAALVHLKPQTMRSLRSKGGGPKYCRLSANRIVYRIADLEQWAEGKLRASTAEYAPLAARDLEGIIETALKTEV